jgi:hypothetical protein
MAARVERHGTANEYNNHGCRCDRCRVAWADYMYARRPEPQPRKLRKDAASPKQRGRMRRMYDAGKTLREIEKATGFSRAGIANYLHADGGGLRPRGQRTKVGGRGVRYPRFGEVPGRS